MLGCAVIGIFKGIRRTPGVRKELNRITISKFKNDTGIQYYFPVIDLSSGVPSENQRRALKRVKLTPAFIP